MNDYQIYFDEIKLIKNLKLKIFTIFYLIAFEHITINCLNSYVLSQLVYNKCVFLNLNYRKNTLKYLDINLYLVGVMISLYEILKKT